MRRKGMALLCVLLANLMLARAALAQAAPALSVSGLEAAQTLAALEELTAQELETAGWMRAIWATGESGAEMYAGERTEDAVVATLAPGIFLQGWRQLEGEAIFVRLGAGEDSLAGCIRAYTWVDNGAHCKVGYPVYQQAGTLVELLGVTEDGREIVRRDGKIELLAHWDAKDAVALESLGSYFVYPEPMTGELSDEAIMDAAAEALAARGEGDRINGEPLTEQGLRAFQPRVERWVDPQFGVRTAMVYFEDGQGVCHAVAEVDPASGFVVATNDNG